MKTKIETIKENIERLENRLRRTKNKSQRKKVSQIMGQWTFLLQRAEREYNEQLERLDQKFKPWTDALAASEQITEEDMKIIIR